MKKTAWLLVLTVLCCARAWAGECFAIYGDSRTNHAVHRRVVEGIIKTDPKAVFLVGDLVEQGQDPQEWARFNQITAPITSASKLYPLIGNHDLGGKRFQENFELPNNEQWYSIEQDGILFIMLDDNSDLKQGSAQYAWFEACLKARGEKAKFTVVMFHRPVFTTGSHAEDEAGIKGILLPLFEKYKVSLVVNGHVHAYERLFVNGVYYVVTGGGGAPLSPQSRTVEYSQVYLPVYHFCQLCPQEDRLAIRALDLDGRVIDQFFVPKR